MISSINQLHRNTRELMMLVQNIHRSESVDPAEIEELQSLLSDLQDTVNEMEDLLEEEEEEEEETVCMATLKKILKIEIDGEDVPVPPEYKYDPWIVGWMLGKYQQYQPWPDESQIDEWLEGFKVGTTDVGEYHIWQQRLREYTDDTVCPAHLSQIIQAKGI